MKRHIGMDVHAASTTIAVLSATGKVLRTMVVETNGQTLVEALKGIAGEPIAAGPDGNIWFVNIDSVPSYKVGRITTSGTLLPEYPLPASMAGGDIAAGPDGNMWLTISQGLGRIDIASGTLHSFSDGQPVEANTIPTREPIRSGLVVGADSQLWFAYANIDGSSAIQTMDASGMLTARFLVGNQAFDAPTEFALAPDGNIWFVVPHGGPTDPKAAAAIGRITPSGSIALFRTPDPNAAPEFLVVGPDGNIWFTEAAANKIAVLRQR